MRVIARTPTSFRLVTLDGHLEAGQIEFRAEEGEEEVEVTIESWARSGDRWSNVMYQQLRMAKEVQLHMWASFLERVVALSGGQRSGGIEIDTRKIDLDAVPGERLLGDPSVRHLLDSLHAKDLNFDLSRRQGAHATARLARRRLLPTTPPGATGTACSRRYLGGGPAAGGGLSSPTHRS